MELLSLAEHISQLGTWEIRLEEQKVSWSKELFKIYGFERDDFIPDVEINNSVVAPEFKEKVLKGIADAIQQKSSFSIEYQILQPSGLRKYVLGQGYYIEQANKLVGTVQDITQMKEATLKLKINESLLREAEAVSHSGSWEWMEEADHMLWSDEMYKIHGHLPHSVFVTLTYYRGLIHEEDRDTFFQNCSNAYYNKRSFKLNYRIVTPNGEIRHLQSTGEYKRISLNDNYAYIGNTQDVTLLREAQVQLEEKMLELRRSNQDLEQFAYVASHDLQEPLRKIQAFGTRLRDKFSDQLDEEGRDYLSRMHISAERMRKLIDDLLTFSKTTRAHKDFSDVSLSRVLNRCFAEFDHLIESKGIVINGTFSEHIDGLETQLDQLFLNLVGNALKFTSDERQTVVELKSEIKLGHELNISKANQFQRYFVGEIKDNGIGFDESECEKIFDVFHRLNSRAEFSGTGIGLAICKKIVENHEGFITAAGIKNLGATFTVILPIKQHKVRS
ncbi:MAG: PAS domain S-box protein [Pedobacter sp.]|nr:MAG: PAS domain S-box protein [Pedobacter sp.]